MEQQIANLSLGRGIQPSKGFKGNLQGLCSVYKFNIKPGMRVFRYDVEIIRADFEKSLTKGGADDGQKCLYRQICREIVAVVYNRTEFFRTRGRGADEALYVYDSRKNLFTNVRLEMERQTFTLEPAELPPFSRRFLKDSTVVVQIVPSEAFELDLNDVGPSLCSDVTLQGDRSLRTFLELLTSQWFLTNATHEMIGMGKLFEKKPIRALPDGVVTIQGMSKGVRIIENHGHPVPALVLDVKTCAFYNPITMDIIIRNRMGRGPPDHKFWCNAGNFFKGVRGYLTYAPSRSIVIFGFTTHPVRDLVVEVDGKAMALADFFKKRYNVTVTNLDWPAIRAEGSRDSVYPLQVVNLIPNQRVPLEKMNEFISRELLNANTTNPDVRYRTINEQVRSIATGQSGAFIERFGVRIDPEHTVPIGIRNPPTMEFGGKKMVVPANGRFDERGVRVILPGKKMTKGWMVAHSSQIPRGDAEKWGNSIKITAMRMGIVLPPPVFDTIDVEELEHQLREVASKFDYFLYIDSKRTKSHDLLKLMEMRYKIITQQVTVETLQKAGGATLENIVSKLNTKFFGLNYIPRVEKLAQALELDNSKILVLAYDVSHPAPATPFEQSQLRKKELDYSSPEPSVVGMVANCVKENHRFVGDYFYQASRREGVDENCLQSRMKWVLTKYVQNKGPSVPLPELIIVIRDGVSEGQITMAVTKELPALKLGCNEFRGSYRPKFVFVVVNKTHQKRFFLKDGERRIENTVPGSVIDQKIVRPDIPEFFMQSHRPLKGTAKLPEYTIPINEVGLSTDQLQAFLNAMCHGHQIVNSAISVPAPVYQAHELAKRGRNNYMALKNNFPQAVPRHPKSPLIDFNMLTQRLSGGMNEITNTRFNA